MGLRGPKPRDLKERLHEKLERRGKCLVWTGSKDKDGYGSIKVNGKTLATHRLAWELENGKIPEGKLIRHTCDNPPCCDTIHMKLGNDQDNKNDAVSRGRHNRGEKQRSAKLTEKEVLEIREKYATGRYTQKGLAAEYSISQGTLAQLVNRKTWKHI